MSSQSKIEALLNLFDDPDPAVSDVVKKQFFEMGVHIVPDLEKLWEQSLSQSKQEQIEDLIQQLQFNELLVNFKNWFANGGKDLLYGCYLLAKFQFPDLEFSPIESEIESISKSVWVEVNDNLTALEKVNVINQILYKKYKFGNNAANYYSPQNSFLNQVLESKKGNAITLAVIYLSIAQKLDLPVYGVNLPKNFIMVYKDTGEDIKYQNELDRMLFYINPLNKGMVLGKQEIDAFLYEMDLKQNDIFYLPCSHVDILLRMMKNLKFAYEKLGYQDKLSRLEILIDIAENQ